MKQLINFAVLTAFSAACFAIILLSYSHFPLAITLPIISSLHFFLGLRDPLQPANELVKVLLILTPPVAVSSLLLFGF